MALHGHTKIELQDVITGEKKVIEDDNMVTNGLAKMLRPANGWANVFGSRRFYAKGKYDYYLSMIDNLLGGIVCFEKTHEENPENFFKDPLNKIIAKASTYAYTGLDKTQGSYNIEESGFQQDGSFKKVWDFSTNQGNGTIASVSLTTRYYGENGDGCLVQDEANKVSSQYPLESLKVLGNGGSQSVPDYNGYTPTLYLNDAGGNWRVSNYVPAAAMFCYADYKGNYVLFLDNINNIYYNASKKSEYFYEAKKICLQKLRVPFSKVSPFTNPYDLKFNTEKYEITIPETITAQCSGYYDCFFIFSDIGYIYMVMAKDSYIVNTGEILRVLKINMNDFSTDVISITNTTPTAICISGGNYPGSSSYRGLSNGYGSGGIIITNEYFIFLSHGSNDKKTDEKIYRINIKNNSDIAVFKMDGEDYIANGSYAFFQRTGSMIYTGSLALNLKSMEVKYCKTYYNNNDFKTWFNENMNTAEIIFEAIGENAPVFYKFVGNASSNDTYLCLTPCFRIDTLMTINNLPEPVIKTASQTMKITYTITEE